LLLLIGSYVAVFALAAFGLIMFVIGLRIALGDKSEYRAAHQTVGGISNVYYSKVSTHNSGATVSAGMISRKGKLENQGRLSDEAVLGVITPPR
ncbi:MAG: hypothetical protein RIF34_01465, partial [Candidatus Kapaibacterium sp.]